MSSSTNQGVDLYSQMPQSLSGRVDSGISDLYKTRDNASDLISWSIAQSNALSKLGIYTGMAKKINDQP